MHTKSYQHDYCCAICSCSRVFSSLSQRVSPPPCADVSVPGRRISASRSGMALALTQTPVCQPNPLAMPAPRGWSRQLQGRRSGVGDRHRRAQPRVSWSSCLRSLRAPEAFVLLSVLSGLRSFAPLTSPGRAFPNIPTTTLLIPGWFEVAACGSGWKEAAQEKKKWGRNQTGEAVLKGDVLKGGSI